MKIDPTDWEDVTDLLTATADPTQMVLETPLPIDDYLALEEYALAHHVTVSEHVRTTVLDLVHGHLRSAPDTKANIVTSREPFNKVSLPQSQGPRSDFQLESH